MWNCMSRGELKLKVDGTMVKLGRAAGLTGAMHEGGKKREKKKKVKANFCSLIHGYENTLVKVRVR